LTPPAHTHGTVTHLGSALSTKVFFGHATACPDCCCCCCCWLSTNRTQLHQSLVTHMYRNIDTVYCALNIATHETGTLVPGVLAATPPIPRPLHPTVVRMIRTALLSVVCLSLSISGYLCWGSLALKLKPVFCLCGPPPCCHGALQVEASGRLQGVLDTEDPLEGESDLRVRELCIRNLYEAIREWVKDVRMGQGMAEEDAQEVGVRL
jgi:hypothetical protein